jgi:hypothetical protein
MATEIPLFTARTQVPTARPSARPGVMPGAPFLVNPQAAGLGAVAAKAAADFAAIGDRVQAGVRTRAMGEAITELGRLQQEVDETNDPAALGPLVLRRRQEIEAKVNERLGSDAEGRELIGVRLADNFSQITRGAAARGRALESDAFKAQVVEGGRELSARAAAGGAAYDTALADYRALLAPAVAAGRITRTEAASLEQRWQADAQGAQVLRMVRDQPGAVAMALADPRQFSALTAIERERYITAAAGRQQALAAQSIAAANRNDLVQRRQAEAASNTAEKDIIDALRRQDTAAASDALGRLRQFGTGAQYRTFEGMVSGQIEDVPTTPTMRGFLAERLTDRANPLTREEAGDLLRRGLRGDAGGISMALYDDALKQIEARQDARVREADEFVQRQLGVPSGVTPDGQLQPWQRTARNLHGEIMNELVKQRLENQNIDPLRFVRDYMKERGSPDQVLQQQRNAQAAATLARNGITRQRLEEMQQQLDARAAYRGLSWAERQTAATPRAPVYQGGAVTQDQLNRWRATLDQAGVE